MGKFEFTEYIQTADWFSTLTHTIDPSEYHSLHLELRYQYTWWLIGVRADRTEEEIGHISDCDLVKLLEWSQLESGGSMITQITSLANKIDLVTALTNILRHHRTTNITKQTESTHLCPAKRKIIFN